MFNFHRSASSTSSEESGVDKLTGSQLSGTSWPGVVSIFKSFTPGTTDFRALTTDANITPKAYADTFSEDKPCVTLIRSRLDYQTLEDNQTYFHAGLNERRTLPNSVDKDVQRRAADNVEFYDHFNTESGERQRKRDKFKGLIRKVIDRVRQDKESTEPTKLVKKQTISLPLAGSLRR